MNNKYYLDQDGVQLLIDYINNGLDKKLDNSTAINTYAAKTDLNNYATKSELNSYTTLTQVQRLINNIPTYDDSNIQSQLNTLSSKLSSVYRPKGNVATDEDLDEIVNPEVGDVYNIIDTGANAVWTGTEWDMLSPIVDLSDYVRVEDVETMTTNMINDILYSGKSAVVTDTTGLNRMLANEQPVVTITLNDDISLTNDMIEIPEGKTVTLKLDDNTISGNGAATLFVKGNLILEGGEVTGAGRTIMVRPGGSLTVNDTDIVSAHSHGISATGANSQVTINGGNITAQEYGLVMTNGTNVVVNGGYLKGLDNFGLGGNGSPYVDHNGNTTTQTSVDGIPTTPVAPVNVTINGGTIEGQIVSAGYIATGIYWPINGTLNINGGTIKGACGIVQRGGTVNIGNDAVIIANGASSVTGKAGDSRVVVGPYAIVFDKSASYPDTANMSLNIAANASLTGTDGDISKLPANAEGIVDNR